MNLIIKKTSDIRDNDLLNCLKLWNDEMGYVYPISSNSFYQNVIDYKDKDVMIYYDDERVIGFIFLKRFSDDRLVNYSNNLYISLFYVSKKYRKQGIGSSLFDFAEEIRDGKELIIGKEINNFFPGVPTDFDNLTDVWLEKRGFVGKRYTHDLITKDPKIYEIRNKDVEYKYCDDSQKEELIQMMINNNWGRWALEAKEYFEKKTENDKNAYIVGMVDGKIISFAKVNDYKMYLSSYNLMWKERFENLGGFGPLGVDRNYRKKGIGFDMISVSLNDLVNKGCKTIILDWTGLMELYAKFNFEVWKSYKYMSKSFLKID
jgi:predicted N-acetyltransferase YhbS